MDAKATNAGKYNPAGKQQSPDSKDTMLDQGIRLQACFSSPDLLVSAFGVPPASGFLTTTPSATTAITRSPASHRLDASLLARTSMQMARPLVTNPASCPATSHRPFEPPSPAAEAPCGARAAAADPFHDDWPYW